MLFVAHKLLHVLRWRLSTTGDTCDRKGKAAKGVTQKGVLDGAGLSEKMCRCLSGIRALTRALPARTYVATRGILIPMWRGHLAQVRSNVAAVSGVQ